MATRIVEWQLPYTWGTGIWIDANKVISVLLRAENNLIEVNGDNELYTDLQLVVNIKPSDTFPVGVTTGKILQSDWRPKSGLILNWKTTSGDYARWIYANDWKIYFDNWTGTWKQVYYSSEVDGMIQMIYNYIDSRIIISAVAPANPTEWMLWYDTTNDVLKTYDGSQWNTGVLSVNWETWHVTIPLPPAVIDGLTSTSTTDALSANQGRILNWKIADMMALGKFLSLWNASTGQPMSFPMATPYTYTTWDYFIVETVSSATPPVNYRPSGSSYTGTASSTAETDELEVWDVYVYDWSTWLLQSNHGKTVTFANIAGQPTDNTNLATALGNKQDTLVSGTNIKTINNTSLLGSGDITISAPTYTAGDHIDITSNVISTKWLQDELTAGDNITISPSTESDMKWPAPSGFHVPTADEWNYLFFNVLAQQLGMSTNDRKGEWMGTYFKMPLAGRRSWSNGNVMEDWTYGHYWTSSYKGWRDAYSRQFTVDSRDSSVASRAWRWCSVRCFKNTPVVPDSSWTTLYAGSWVKGVFHNASLWLISINGDGTTWYTIADKNLWATTVYNRGDTLTDANCGWFFQRWNNYIFPRSWTVTTSSTQIDASGYGPWNYYYSSTYITDPYEVRDTSSNPNLWWWVTQSTWVLTTISATDTTYTAWTWINIDANNEISCTVTPWATYTAGDHIDITSNVISTKWLQNELTAGNNISISSNTESDMKGPAPSGFHIPLSSEWQSVITIITDSFGISDTGDTLEVYLKLPMAWMRDYYAGSVYETGSHWHYWTASSINNDNIQVDTSSEYVHIISWNQANWFSIRCFKNTAVTPDSSWTALYTWTWNAWIFHNATEWLISISGDGTTWITIADKNLWATTVFNYWDTGSETNCGWYYQRWNNYMFPFTWSITTSNTQVDASGYWPWNYYSSSTFIKRSQKRDSSNNANLWWWVSQWTYVDSTVISATFTVVSSTAPSTPQTWQLWYDTANSTLNVYDGSTWQAV